MVKQQRRTSRKVNFKSRLPVHIGLSEAHFDPPTDFKRKDADSDDEKVETGVDKDEEGEVHLQNFIQSSAAALLGPRGGQRAGQQVKAAAAYIPTPDATGQADGYERFYAQTVFAEPSTLIRYSDTVEDLFPIEYFLDEEDHDWLQRHNAEATPNGSTSPDSKGRKGKGKEVTRTVLSEDDFEAIMDAFEKLCDETDLSRVPPLESMMPVFDSPRLTELKMHAKATHEHWTERRTTRGGKPIIPQLDHDETREDNPYVCFRRREAKNVRKTRRTDAQNVERLVRLRVDLSSALELLQQVAQRERIKRETVDIESGVFEARVKLREVKRAAGENEGDDDLLIAKKERKRRRIEEFQAPMLPLGAQARPGYQLPLKLPRAEILAAQAQPQVPILAEPLIPFRDRTGQVSARMDHDMQKKRESDREWEDWTDGAFLLMPLSTPARHWRTPDAVNMFTADGSKETVYAFGSQHSISIGGARPAYRKRFGRGGRVVLDRVLPRPRTPRTDDPEVIERLSSQWRFDSDATLELPSHDDDSVLDDYALQYMAARISLIADELPQLAPSSAWCKQVADPWLARESDVPPPNIVIGKLPTRPPPPNQQSAQMALQAQNGMHSAQAQLAFAAAQARQQQQAHAQAAMIKAPQQSANAIGNGTPQTLPPQLRRADSATGLPVNGVSLPAQWANMVGQKPDGSPSLQNVQLLQQMQNAAMAHSAAQRQNGSPVLSNGIPRAPPFASPGQQPAQPNGIHAPRPPSAASNGSPGMMASVLMQSPAPQPVSLPSPQQSPGPSQNKKQRANLQLGQLPAFKPISG